MTPLSRSIRKYTASSGLFDDRLYRTTELLPSSISVAETLMTSRPTGKSCGTDSVYACVTSENLALNEKRLLHPQGA